MNPTLSLESLRQAENINTEFDDYPRFEVPATERDTERLRFLAGSIYAPEYNYRKLEYLYDTPKDDKVSVTDKKTRAQGAVLELNSAKGSNLLSDAELDLYANYHEVRLNRMALVDNARRMSMSPDSADQQTAREQFMAANERLFGSLNERLAKGMLGTERAQAEALIPQNNAARGVRAELLDLLDPQLTAEPEIPIADAQLLAKLHDHISEAYAPVLAAVPDTDDEHYYDAAECQDIMQKALEAGGLAQQGWSVVIRPGKSGVSTNQYDKTISLPSNTRRNARELRRLVLHEQEVHARRAQNGDNAGSKLLLNGTADYADVEEGLGVLLECAYEGNLDNASFYRARDRYITAGLALGADGLKRDARQTFAVLWRILALRNTQAGRLDAALIASTKEQAYTHIENAFRGTNYAMPGIIYTKLKVYYEGLQKNGQFFAEHADDLPATFATVMRGKYNHTDQAESEKITTILQSQNAS